MASGIVSIVFDGSDIVPNSDRDLLAETTSLLDTKSGHRVTSRPPVITSLECQFQTELDFSPRDHGLSFQHGGLGHDEGEVP